MSKRETPEEWYARQGVEPPEKISHGITDDKIIDNLVKFKATSWRQQGNQLIAEGEMGRLVQRIPSDVICKGMNEQGLPILEKVVIS